MFCLSLGRKNQHKGGRLLITTEPPKGHSRVFFWTAFVFPHNSCFSWSSHHVSVQSSYKTRQIQQKGEVMRHFMWCIYCSFLFWKSPSSGRHQLLRLLCLDVSGEAVANGYGYCSNHSCVTYLPPACVLRNPPYAVRWSLNPSSISHLNYVETSGNTPWPANTQNQILKWWTQFNDTNTGYQF